MTKQKIQRFITFLGATAVLSLPVIAQAAGNFGLDEAAGKAQYATGSGNTVYGWVQTSITVLLSVLAFVFFFLTLYAGIQWMLARGNEEKIAEYKGTIEAAIIGLVIVMAAYAITTFVFRQLGQ